METAHDIALVTAANPGPLTLEGTNTWLVGRDPCWIVDPGPALHEHVEAVAAEARRRGGAGGIALTHDHADHVAGVDALRAALDGPPVGAARHPADTRLGDGDTFGPFRVIEAPGHAPDHVVLVAAGAGFTGDAVLGTGSVFIAPDPGALRGYLAMLERLRAMRLTLLCPGHGPIVRDPDARLAEYLAHRREREARLLDAIADGLRSADELLRSVWADVPAALREAARATLAAHLDKLDEEGQLPADVERPR